MSEINWNPKQQEAIEKKNTGIVVSAAAGSGKTTVMIERLSRLLLDENNKIHKTFLRSLLPLKLRQA